MKISRVGSMTALGGFALFVFLPDNGSGEGGCQLCLKIIQFGLQGQNCVIDLFLVVSVNPGNGEGSNPAKSYNGEAVHDGAKVGQEIHDNSELKIMFYFLVLTLLKLLGIR